MGNLDSNRPREEWNLSHVRVATDDEMDETPGAPPQTQDKQQANTDRHKRQLA